MTNYPINYTYTRDGALTDGFAATEAEALQVERALMIEGGNEECDLPTAMHLTTREAGHVSRDRESLAQAWSKEIAAGYASIIQVWGGFKIEIETWEGSR